MSEKNGTKQLHVKFRGVSPILMNPMTEAQLLNLHDSKAYPAVDTKGKKPVEVAAMRLYRNEEGRIGIPATNLFAAIISAGTGFMDPSVKGGKSKLSTQEKSVIPSFLFLETTFCVFTNIPKPFDPKNGLNLDDTLGKTNPFATDMRRGVNRTTKGATAIIRPRIDRWEFEADFSFDASACTQELLRELFGAAGKRCGLGDFRPARKGPFGRFEIAEWVVKD